MAIFDADRSSKFTKKIKTKMASRKNRKHTLQRSASTLTSTSTNSSKTSTFGRIWGSFRRSQSSTSVSEGFKVVDEGGKINVEIIKSICELDNSVVSFNHGKVETIPPGKSWFKSNFLVNTCNFKTFRMNVFVWAVNDCCDILLRSILTSDTRYNFKIVKKDKCDVIVIFCARK